MAQGSSGNQNGQPKQVFTLDTGSDEPVEIPSVTRLLNRKKLGLPDRSRPSPAAKPAAQEPPPIPDEPPPVPQGWQAQGGQQASPKESGIRPVGGKVAIQKVAIRAKPKAPRIARWTDETLQAANDPFQKAVHYLIQKGAREVLLLTPPSTVTNANADTHFDAFYAYASDGREELLRGLTLSSKMIPEIWEKIFTVGVFEIIPSVALQTTDEAISFLRHVFGLHPTDFFILIRCGSPQECTGILAIVSSASLRREIALAFNAPTVASRAA